MIAYVDSSVVLRFVLQQRGALTSWTAIELGVGSRLVEVECLRALDRLRLHPRMSEETLVERREYLHRLLERMERVEVSRAVLERAAQPFPTSIGTLDAIHLSTALLWRERSGESPTFATHDTRLAIAARSFGLPVVGV